MHHVAGVTLIDESYNASPASMKQSLAMLASLPATRRIAVLGDMRELGAETAALHAEVGRVIAGLPIDKVYWVGENAEVVIKAAREINSSLPIDGYADVAVMAGAFLRDAKSGDVVVAKGSRAMKLDEFVVAVVNALGGN